MTEPRETKLKRLHMRSIRRGIKEMDLILTAYATDHMPGLSDAELVTYDDFLAEYDHDIYGWITGTGTAPAEYAHIMSDIMKLASGLTRPN
ncbi:antitoxin CptB [Loktanella ponticola]|uniref:FAD assembly factor SdhE n=1 Tax=Yoonia ponticola TaxID=1524255 RepID=A0A7W9EWR6_9RHOB|nr:succinate dehydrogenase assembly factor 2 [Yoonia ponticola]MBB5720893.1 antitoxin CptB [Yoonia ponticola]